ncbi:Scr1 family TA system antitoxin-like transcriptional regulator [Streptomyces sp. NPDC058632]|uniref:Scr1 family TA system antitoxin-like transcriptional regulator n=1 Tax=unclassified Streptomyces TaxID=2593676 RepID=UPI0036620D5D
MPQSSAGVATNASEAEAIAVSWYELLLILGLLQTGAYAQALMGASSPSLDEETINERVAARLRRQEALTDGSACSTDS